MPSTGLVPNVGESKMLQHVLNAAGPENTRVRLFKNDITPTSTMTLSDYTEATFTGYAAVTVSSSGWEVLGETAYVARYTLGSVTFTCSGTTSENIYGFYLTEVNSSTLMWSERFDETSNFLLEDRSGYLILEDGSGRIVLEGSVAGMGLHTITYPGDSISIRPAVILTRTGTPAGLTTGLVASWPLTESSGTRRDLMGQYDLLPYYEEWVTGAAAASSSAGPTGNVTRFTQGHAVLTDLQVSGTSGSNTVITSAAGGLPVYTVGQHFHVTEHSVSGDNGMYVATGTPTAFSVSCTKQTWNTEVPSNSAAEAAKVRNVSWLYRGDRATLGLGSQFAIGAWGQINLDGTLGISLTCWLKVRTGAIVGQSYFVNGVAFTSNMNLNDANSTVLTLNFSLNNDAGGITQAGTVLTGLDLWNFVACIYDPVTGKASISINGGAAVLGSAIVGGHPQIGVGYDAGCVMVGGIPTGTPSYSNSDMSQLNLFNRVITAAEITYLMTKRPI